MEVGFS